MGTGLKARSYILKAALFATGLSGIVAEYVLSTLATYFLGDSVFQWTMIVSIMLFSMGIGSRFSRLIEKNLLLSFIGIEFLLSILASFSSLLAYSVAAYTAYTGVLIYGLSISIGLLIGLEIPLVTRLNSEFESLKVNISSVLENDYYGSLLGGVFFAFIGLPLIGLTYTPFILGGINFIVAVCLFFILHEHYSRLMKKWVYLWGSATLIVLVVGVSFAKPIVTYGEQLKYKDKVVFAKQSKYQKIVITQWKNDYWLFINGNQQLSSLDEELYHEPLVHPVMKLAKEHKKILVLGGGDGAAVRELLKYPEIESIKLVDLDPVMTDLGKENEILLSINEGALNDPKVEIINQDGFKFLEEENDFYDVIIIDLPDPKTIELGRLYSFEFYRLCYKRLRPNGFLITQAGSPYYAAKAFKCIDKTLHESGFSTLKLHNQVLTLGEWGWIIGSKTLSEGVLKQQSLKLDFTDLETVWLNQEAMLLMTSFGKDFYLNGDTTVKVNRVHDPVIHKYYLKGSWDLY
ncbi:MAG: polyamine aminopropyltransferase [Bacteroidota bacterium]